MVLSAPNFSSGLLPGFFNSANSYTSGWLGVIILLTIGVVSFLGSKLFSYERAFAVSSSFVLVSTIFLRYAGMVNNAVFTFSVIYFAISIIALIRERSVENV